MIFSILYQFNLQNLYYALVQSHIINTCTYYSWSVLHSVLCLILTVFVKIWVIQIKANFFQWWVCSRSFLSKNLHSDLVLLLFFEVSIFLRDMKIWEKLKKKNYERKKTTESVFNLHVFDYTQHQQLLIFTIYFLLTC